ncbi:HNH endonuclease signature motif containing protein [Uniformispora flossi]|uniref:HNH endonuclease signature motif containing protein n=1 Tax=Uniformispora flossi TaxID=3390723 RepID=UPI003C30B29B
MPAKHPDDKARLRSFVELKDGHWLWTGSTNRKGYGRFWFQGRSEEAHRVAYELFVGPIPDGLQIDHVCRVRPCVNPEHLEPVTHEENYRRGNGVFGPPPFERCRSGRHLMSQTRVFRGIKNPRPRCGVCEQERIQSYKSKKGR